MRVFKRVDVLSTGSCLLLLTTGLVLGSPLQAEVGGGDDDSVEQGAATIPADLHLDPVAAQALASDGPSFEGAPPLDTSGEGSGLRFQDVAAESGVRFRYTFGDYAYDNILESSGSGATWIDYDRDGDLDLYLLNGVYLEGVSDPKGKRSFGEASDHF